MKALKSKWYKYNQAWGHDKTCNVTKGKEMTKSGIGKTTALNCNGRGEAL